MENTKEFLSTLPMYYNHQIGWLDKLVLAWNNDDELDQELKVMNENLLRPGSSQHEITSNLFDNKFFKSGSSHTRMGIVHSDGRIIDETTEYSNNTMGFRSKEFSKDDKILALGCSHTHGMGLRNDLVWTQQLAKMLGIDEIPNVASPGGSVMLAVQNAFKYFYAFGNPEYVLLFAPDLYRFRTTQNPKFNIPNHMHTTIDRIAFMEQAWVNPTPYTKREKLIKAPYLTPDIIPVEYVFWLNMQFLSMLITYCRSNGIKLIWNSWHMPFADLAQSFKNQSYDLYDEFFYIDFNKFSNKPADQFECHAEVKASGPEYFNYALDTKMAGTPHWGSHLHIHIAEEFEKQMYLAGYEK